MNTAASIARKVFAGVLILFAIPVTSCAPPRNGDETLLLYARSREVYQGGGFAKAAEMLAGEKHFIPALVLRGKAEYLSGDLSGAEKSLKRARAGRPGNVEASLFLARVYRETGKADEAAKIAEEILAGNPQDIRALRFAAELAGEKGAPGVAAKAALLDRAVEASAELALVFLDRARFRWVGGNSSGALEDLGRAKVLLSRESPVMKGVSDLESIISEVSSK